MGIPPTPPAPDAATDRIGLAHRAEIIVKIGRSNPQKHPPLAGTIRVIQPPPPTDFLREVRLAARPKPRPPAAASRLKGFWKAYPTEGWFPHAQTSALESTRSTLTDITSARPETAAEPAPRQKSPAPGTLTYLPFSALPAQRPPRSNGRGRRDAFPTEFRRCDAFPGRGDRRNDPAGRCCAGRQPDGRARRA